MAFFMAERTITALKAQQRNPNRINVFLDGQYAFSLARIVAAWLRPGAQISDTKISQLLSQDETEKAFLKAVQFISVRPRSENEVSQRLKLKGVSPEVVAQVIDRLRQAGLLSDESFARNWVENRSAFRPRSARMLAMELRQKGVNDQIIQDSLPDSEDEIALALLAARKYVQRLHNLDWKTFQQRLGGFLMRRGFSYEVVKPIVQQLWEERPADLDMIMENDEVKDDAPK
jgi:regulatory protein